MQELVGWISRIMFNLSFIPTKSNPPERFFLRDISALNSMFARLGTDYEIRNQ